MGSLKNINKLKKLLVKVNRKKERRHKLAISEIKEVSATDSVDKWTTIKYYNTVRFSLMW